MRLQKALNLYIPDSLVLNQLKSHLSLHRVKDNLRVLYSSAIALELSQAKNTPAQEIATAIATLIRQTSSSLDLANELNFIVQVVPPGLIHLELTELAIAAWLQSLVYAPPWFSRETTQGSVFIHHSPLTITHLFDVQYAHARCCSLLRLAQREGLINLRQLHFVPHPAFWLIVTPDPIPWVNFEQNFCLTHPAESALIAQLVHLLDDLFCPSPSRRLTDWEKAALNLSQAFQTFYSYCRIWGEVKVQTLKLSQARLGLVHITQSVLRLLLQDVLNVCAPLEL